ncbi:MAG TPA: hypothetical protein VHM90_08360 [Phycisphaerae bacterium]|nr:hypothetical protein [Phycisphaerae bacterium]
MIADMTANSTNTTSRQFDPVRARVHYEPHVTNAERMQAEEAARSGAERRKTSAPLGIEMLTDTRFGRYVGGMHPGDIVYWVAGLGAACLLLIKATI